MKTSMTYPIRFWALVLTGLLLYQFSSPALADSCKYSKDIDLTLNLSDSNMLSVYATAGDLAVVGNSRSNQAVVSGKVCASKEAWLEEWMPKLTSTDSPINPYRVIWELMHAVDLENTIITHDAGSPRDQLSPFWESRCRWKVLPS